MKIKNYTALLAILAISAFLYAHSNNTLAPPAYYTQQLYLFKQLIKKYPRLLKNNAIKSWVAYIEYISHQQTRTIHKPQKLLTPQTHARLSELYIAALKLKHSSALQYKSQKRATHGFPAPAPTLVPDNQEQKQTPTLYAGTYSWRTFPIAIPPSYESVTFSTQNQMSDKNRAFRNFVNEMLARHHASRSNYYDDDYEIISLQTDDNYNTQEEYEEEVLDPISEYHNIKYDQEALHTVRQTIKELPASTLIELTHEMRDSHIVGAYEELSKRFTKTNNSHLHKQQLWLERKILKLYKSRQGIRSFFRRLYQDKLSTHNKLKLEDLYEHICDQREAAADMRHSICVLQTTKSLNSPAQATLKKYYNQLTTDPLLKYRLNHRQKHFVLHNSAPLIHRDILSTLNEYNAKSYPTKTEEDTVLSLKRYLNTPERHLRKLINPNSSTSCYHTIVQYTDAIQNKRSCLETFEKHTGIEQECIRTLERNWDIPYQELTTIYTDDEQTIIHQETIYCLKDINPLYCLNDDQKAISALTRCTLHTNAQGDTEQASRFLSCMKSSFEFIKGSLAGSAEQAVQYGIGLVVGAKAAEIAAKILIKIGTRAIFPVQLGMAFYGIYQSGHILKEDYYRIKDAFSKGDMYELGNACTNATCDTVDAAFGLKALKNTLKAAYKQGIFTPTVQAIKEGVQQAEHQAEVAAEKNFCPDHMNYQRHKNCHAIRPPEIAHCTIDNTRANKLVEHFKKITDKAKLSIERLKHIFEPDIRCYRGQKPTLSGWHHDYQGKIKQTGTIEVSVIEKHPSGAYLAEWSYKGETKRSTFFPDHWPPEEVVTKIGEVLEGVHTSTKATNGNTSIRGTTSCGLKIFISQSPSGEILSVYPIIE